MGTLRIQGFDAFVDMCQDVLGCDHDHICFGF